MAREVIISKKNGRTVLKSRPAKALPVYEDNTLRRAVRIDHNTLVLTKHINQTDEQVRSQFLERYKNSIINHNFRSVNGGRNSHSPESHRFAAPVSGIKINSDAGGEVLPDLEAGGEDLGFEIEGVSDQDNND